MVESLLCIVQVLQIEYEFHYEIKIRSKVNKLIMFLNSLYRIRDVLYFQFLLETDYWIMIPNRKNLSDIVNNTLWI